MTAQRLRDTVENLRWRAGVAWALGDSCLRALKHSALGVWRVADTNVTAAQQALRGRARCGGMAHRDEYSAAVRWTAA
jgi:fructose-bisphosphate aldolase class 1